LGRCNLFTEQQNENRLLATLQVIESKSIPCLANHESPPNLGANTEFGISQRFPYNFMYLTVDHRTFGWAACAAGQMATAGYERDGCTASGDLKQSGVG
jgi:hypothetical protein